MTDEKMALLKLIEHRAALDFGRALMAAAARTQQRTIADALASTQFPTPHWPPILRPNRLERLHKELKRRADVVGICVNAESIVRLVGPLMMEQIHEWAVSRRTMTLETLAPKSVDAVVSFRGMTP